MSNLFDIRVQPFIKKSNFAENKELRKWQK